MEPVGRLVRVDADQGRARAVDRPVEALERDVREHVREAVAELRVEPAPERAASDRSRSPRGGSATRAARRSSRSRAASGRARRRRRARRARARPRASSRRASCRAGRPRRSASSAGRPCVESEMQNGWTVGSSRKTAPPPRTRGRARPRARAASRGRTAPSGTARARRPVPRRRAPAAPGRSRSKTRRTSSVRMPSLEVVEQRVVRVVGRREAGDVPVLQLERPVEPRLEAREVVFRARPSPRPPSPPRRASSSRRAARPGSVAPSPSRGV